MLSFSHVRNHIGGKTGSKPQIFLLDIMLPKVTGLGVLHVIRSRSSIPVLMLTAIDDEYTQVTSFDEQADVVLEIERDNLKAYYDHRKWQQPPLK